MYVAFPTRRIMIWTDSVSSSTQLRKMPVLNLTTAGCPKSIKTEEPSSIQQFFFSHHHILHKHLHQPTTHISNPHFPNQSTKMFALNTIVVAIAALAATAQGAPTEVTVETRQVACPAGVQLCGWRILNELNCRFLPFQVQQITSASQKRDKY